MSSTNRAHILKHGAAASAAVKRSEPLKIEYDDPHALKPDPLNARLHNNQQAKDLERIYSTVGVTSPVLVGPGNQIISGHLRTEVAKRMGIELIPIIRLEGLTREQCLALSLAENQIALKATWDAQKLGHVFTEIKALNPSFEIESTAFTMGEIDFYIENLSLSSNDAPDPADKVPPQSECPPVSKLGDLWLLGNRHRLLCGNALEESAFEVLMEGHKAGVVFTDHPYNLGAKEISGLGKVKHRDFLMASGEMTDAEYQKFLIDTCKLIARHSKNGLIAYLCIDFRHISQMLEAGRIAFRELKNLCVWVKNPGMGSLYRSSHELVLVYKNGTAPHVNNVGLGKNGRHRTNVWSYSSINNFGRAGEEGNLLHMHPTVKPVRLIADAILDCSNRGDIILDSFVGSGSSIIAAERTGRRCFAMELDPRFVDTAIKRFQAYTRESAVHAASGRTFDEIAAEVADVG